MIATLLLLHPLRELGYLGFPPVSPTSYSQLQL
jgi:hypothetical protein